MKYWRWTQWARIFNSNDCTKEEKWRISCGRRESIERIAWVWLINKKCLFATVAYKPKWQQQQYYCLILQIIRITLPIVLHSNSFSWNLSFNFILRWKITCNSNHYSLLYRACCGWGLRFVILSYSTQFTVPFLLICSSLFVTNDRSLSNNETIMMMMANKRNTWMSSENNSRSHNNKRQKLIEEAI